MHSELLAVDPGYVAGISQEGVGYVGDADTWASARQARPEQWLPLPAERHELSGGTWWAVTPPAPGAGTCEAGAR